MTTGTAETALTALTADDRRLARYAIARRLFVAPDGIDFLRYVNVAGRRFERWPHLSEMATAWQSGQSEIDLKARQVGVSWLLAAYATWRMLHGDAVLLISAGQREAIELMSKCKHVFVHLPPPVAGILRKDTETEMRHASGGSILALPSTQDAGRGYTVQLVIADEAAYHPYAAQNYAAYLPALDAGGQLLMVSTAAGPRGFFYDMWRATEAGKTPYVARFIPWYARPGRDGEWLARQRAAFVGLPAEFEQEYPSSPQAAFVQLAGLVYPQFSRQRHVRNNPCDWQRYRRRYAAVDLGGGDPTGVLLAGIAPDGTLQFHKAFWWPGGSGVTLDDTINALWQFHKLAPFHRIRIDPPIGDIVNHYRKLGLPAVAREGKKIDGLQEVANMLESGRLYYDPSCEQVFREYETYMWAERVDPNSKERYKTSTPVDHHAEMMDCTRMIVLDVVRDSLATAGVQPVRHDYSAKIGWQQPGQPTRVKLQ